MFDDFEKVQFPTEHCTIPNEREPEVRDSNQSYLCVLVDSRFPQECRVMVLRPYTCLPCEDDDRGLDLLYGWTDGDNVFDHSERDIHDDHEKVIAWKQVESDFQFTS